MRYGNVQSREKKWCWVSTRLNGYEIRDPTS
jgi:hypothetical protein